ncbi:MAG TPA: glycerophosphodiester phosphodiesterase [Gaiellaceae bacterium]|nr:glycerophosphodiester phosphodiesterase [Gaiellaceae bacterium]
MSLLRSAAGRMLVESHRGCEAGAAAPNTWAAVEEGVRRGADLVELDVQLSRDGVPFLRHHYAGEDGRWAWERDYAAAHGERLDAVLARARAAGVRLTLDLKSPFGGGEPLVDAVLALLEPDDEVVLCAWDHPLLVRAKARRPQTTTRANLRARPVDLAAVLAPCGCDAVGLSYDVVRAEDVAAARAAGVAVCLAEIFVPDWPRVRELGVDVVCHGDPAAARAGLGLG